MRVVRFVPRLLAGGGLSVDELDGKEASEPEDDGVDSWGGGKRPAMGVSEGEVSISASAAVAEGAFDAVSKAGSGAEERRGLLSEENEKLGTEASSALLLSALGPVIAASQAVGPLSGRCAGDG